MRQVEMIFVEGNDNHNKVYRMTPKNDGTWLAEWGRVGNSMQTQIYTESLFEKKYNEKIKKGYRDVTDLRKEVKDTGFAKIADTSVASLLDKLLHLGISSSKSLHATTPFKEKRQYVA